jgi:hypothetical protein
LALKSAILTDDFRGFLQSLQAIIVHVGFEVLAAVGMKNSAFWDITPCTPLKVNRRFGGICCLHLQGRRISQASSTCYLYRDGYVIGLFFDPED